MRLDKFLCEMKIGTRSQVKAILRQGLVTVNGIITKSGDSKVDEITDQIYFRGQPLKYRRFVYYMMNKPKGVVSATRDNTAPTVVSLLGDCGREDIFPVGRLDKDTTGLVFLTNDGDLAHRLLSPKRHVDKTYGVTIARPLTKEEKELLEQGVDIGDKALTLPARVEAVSENRILLTIQEGRFHQVKRMLQAAGNSVLELERISLGGLLLDRELKPGEYRELTDGEVECCYRAAFGTEPGKNP